MKIYLCGIPQPIGTGKIAQRCLNAHLIAKHPHVHMKPELDRDPLGSGMGGIMKNLPSINIAY
jgi:hypothetical protein